MVLSWKYLKSIYFESVRLCDELIVNVLSGCPALETMELFCVDGISRVDIRSSKLKILKFNYYYCDDGSDHSLEIIAPHLQQLEILGDLSDLKCSLVDVPSVVNAKLTFNIECMVGRIFEEEDSCHDYHQVFMTLVQDYLQKLSCAIEITMGTWLTQVLCMLQFKGVTFPELKCKSLTLELHMNEFNLYGAAVLLQISSHAETLNIDITTTHPEHSPCRFELRYLAQGDNIDLQSWISSFAFPKLKNVKIRISPWMCMKNHLKRGYDKKLFKLSEFLLKYASILEKFIFMRRRCKICSMNCVPRYLSRLYEKLLGCSKSSANCVIIFQD